MSGRYSPNYGHTEQKFAQLQIQVADLVKSNNQMVPQVDGLATANIVDRLNAMEYMLQSIVKILSDKGMFTLEDFQHIARQAQEQDVGLVDKPDQVVETGDVALIKFKLSDGEKVIDDQMKAPFAVEVGTGLFPNDAMLVGMKPHEIRMFDVVFEEGRHKLPFPEYLGKTIQAEVMLVGVKLATKRPSLPAVENPPINLDVPTGAESENSIPG